MNKVCSYRSAFGVAECVLFLFGLGFCCDQAFHQLLAAPGFDGVVAAALPAEQRVYPANRQGVCDADFKPDRRDGGSGAAGH